MPRQGRLPARHTLAMFALGLAVYGLASRWIGSPGYMDADYYYATGAQLRAGHGLVEPFLWNYLDDPAGIPHASHLYWMPLPSVISAAGLLLGAGFRAAQLPFVVIAAAMPPLVGQLAVRLSGRRSQAWLAAALAAFPGFYLPFLVTTDAFALYAVIGGLCLWTMASAAERGGGSRWLLAGAMVGLANLTRADAPLLLISGMIFVAWAGDRKLQAAAGLLAGYLLVIAPWWVRNYSETGAIVNPGSARLFWMLEYDDLFSYPASLVSYERWRAAGLAAAFGDRLRALATNLQRLIAENGLIYLWPLAVIGAWRLRSRPYVRLSVTYLALLFAAMTVVYPFVGARGGLFHSGAALMPAVWGLAPIGIERATRWMGRRRGWDLAEAAQVFGIAAVGMAVALTGGLFYARQVRPAAYGQGWNAAAQTYAEVEARFPAAEAGVVAVNNPPGFFVQSGRPAIVIPNGASDTLRAAVARYAAAWVVLEANHPQQLESLYREPDSLDWLLPIAIARDPFGRAVHLLQVVEP